MSETIEVTLTQEQAEEAFEFSIPGLLNTLEENAEDVAEYCRRQIVVYVLGDGERGKCARAVRVRQLPGGKPPREQFFILRQGPRPSYWLVSFELTEEGCDDEEVSPE